MPDLLSSWLLPIIYTIGFFMAFVLPRYHWGVAKLTSVLGLASAVVVSFGTLLWCLFQPLTADALGLTVSLLVALLGWVIINYSSRYLQGEPHQLLFVRAILFTLACVSVLVVSHNLAVIALGWCGTSVGLHYLLTFYRERKAAQIVAHKKFIVSRVADLCLLVALLLIWNSAGTLTLEGLSNYLERTTSMPIGLHWAAALFAMAAILKSAQLPLHGWLIQVMEAPTPVSALLHAGVVNIGGFVLIRIADMVSMATAAQALLVIVGGTSAALASLVMMTRISIKVRLAWSTCAQMGFMLMEVGLGLYELALLHLVAHSLYKAHAFLAAGETVAVAQINDFFKKKASHRWVVWYLGSFIVSTALVYGSIMVWQAVGIELSVSIAALVVVSIGFASLLWFEQELNMALLARGVLRVILLTQLYLAWHSVFATLAPAATQSSVFLLGWVMVGFTLLYCVQIWLRCYPEGRLAQILYPWAYCGFYLDETFTRLTFKFWPARLNSVQAQTLVNRHPIQTGDAS